MMKVNLISKRQLPTMALVGMDLVEVGAEDPGEDGVVMVAMEAMEAMVDGEDGDGAILATFGVN